MRMEGRDGRARGVEEEWDVARVRMISLPELFSCFLKTGGLQLQHEKFCVCSVHLEHVRDYRV